MSSSASSTSRSWSAPTIPTTSAVPTNNWTYDKKDIGNYVNTDLLTASYTAKVKGGDVYSDIGSNACDFALTYWVDGVKLDKKALSVEADQAGQEKR